MNSFNYEGLSLGFGSVLEVCVWTKQGLCGSTETSGVWNRDLGLWFYRSSFQPPTTFYCFRFRIVSSS